MRHSSDRREAGQRLAASLLPLRDRENNLVLGLPRGGVPVGFEIARALGAALDVLTVRNLALPRNREVVFGAIAPGGVRMVDEPLIERWHIPGPVVDAVALREKVELSSREWFYRGKRPFPAVVGMTVILADDCLVTGLSMRAAIEAVRRRAPARVVVAVAMAPGGAAREIASLADEFACLETSEGLLAAREFHERFEPLLDEDVADLLREAWRAPAGSKQEAGGRRREAGRNSSTC